MVFSVLNELLTSCQLPMQIREADIERWLYLKLKSVLPWNVMKSIILALIAVFTHVSLVMSRSFFIITPTT